MPVLLVCYGIIPALASAQTSVPDALSLNQARALARSAEARASTLHTSIVVTVVDASGQTLLVERMTDAQLASLELSERKAVSAVFYKRPSSAFETALAGGKIAVLALPHAMPAGGGIPLFHEGRLVGAIGVSGGNNAQDDDAANHGAQALSW